MCRDYCIQYVSVDVSMADLRAKRLVSTSFYEGGNGMEELYAAR